MKSEDIGSKIIEFIIQHCHDHVEAPKCEDACCEHYNAGVLIIYKGNAQEQLGTFVQKEIVPDLVSELERQKDFKKAYNKAGIETTAKLLKAEAEIEVLQDIRANELELLNTRNTQIEQLRAEKALLEQRHNEQAEIIRNQKTEIERLKEELEACEESYGDHLSMPEL